MRLLLGDSKEKLKEIPDNSVDSVITDPPYGLKFMNRAWDYDVPSVSLWREVLRVLKPGGHLLSFGGTRTYHRMVVAIEDAGFEIRDQVMWIYGSGFPKSLSIDKAIDKAAGAEREVIGVKSYPREGTTPVTRKATSIMSQGGGESVGQDSNLMTAPATDAAKQWQGWGTALKPANEPIVLARKPLSEKTVAKNVLKWGCGALNVDASRIEGAVPKCTGDGFKSSKFAGAIGRGDPTMKGEAWENTQGRWPANVLFDEDAAAVLDEQSGVLSKQGSRKLKDCPSEMFAGGSKDSTFYGDSGGASRFFYVAKAGKSERHKGCRDLAVWESVDLSQLMAELSQLVKDISDDTIKFLSGSAWSTTSFGSESADLSPAAIRFTIATATKLIIELKTSNCSPLLSTRENILAAIRMIEASGSSLAASAAYIGQLKLTTTSAEMASALGVSLALLQTLSKISGLAKRGNVHSTVKPIKLMEYLVRMITPPGGVVLDPFMGSGTTGCAAVNLGFDFIGIEREPEYLAIAEKRIAHTGKESA